MISRQFVNVILKDPNTPLLETALPIADEH